MVRLTDHPSASRRRIPGIIPTVETVMIAAHFDHATSCLTHPAGIANRSRSAVDAECLRGISPAQWPACLRKAQNLEPTSSCNARLPSIRDSAIEARDIGPGTVYPMVRPKPSGGTSDRIDPQADDSGFSNGSEGEVVSPPDRPKGAQAERSRPSIKPRSGSPITLSGVSG